MLKAMKPHIGIFGLRNVGKSSFINCMSGQETAIVSKTAGTTTDPVRKHIEIKPIGPCVIIDTAGIDDIGDLGDKRIKSSYHALNSCDLVILVCDDQKINSKYEKLIKTLKAKNIPWFIVWNKVDLYMPCKDDLNHLKESYNVPVSLFSTKESTDLKEIIKNITELLPEKSFKSPSILGDLVNAGDLIVMVTPIDQEAPKGRLILPQVQAIRDALDNDVMILVLKERELDIFFKRSNWIPTLVITDSQAFLKVVASVPKGIPITSFSILFSRLKGPFYEMVKGTREISNLKDNDNVLILESCSHHTAGDDIGRVKIPRWIRNFTGKKINFDIIAGNDFLPQNTNNYKLVIQCGGCMLTPTEVHSRLALFIKMNIPVTNYGMCIAYTLGIFEKSLESFNIPHSSKEDYL